MSEVKFEKNFFKYGGLKYFRKGAGGVRLMSVGQKKTPLGSAAYLAVEGSIKRANVRGPMRCEGPVTIEWSKQTKGDVEVNGSLSYYGVNGKAALTASYEKAKTADLKLMKFFLDEGALKKILNESPPALEFLDREGADGRCVPAVWIALTGGFAESYKTAITQKGSVTSDVVNGQLEITASHSSQGSTTIALAPNSVIAFSLAKVSRWNSGHTQVAGMEDDYFGRT